MPAPPPEPPDEAAQARARARRNWPVRKLRLGEEPPEDLSHHTTPAERFAMVERLSLDAWAMTGRPLPSYTRDQMPVSVILPSHAPTDDEERS